MAVRLADYYRGHVRRVQFVTGAVFLATNLTFAFLVLSTSIPLHIVLLYVLAPVILLQICGLIIVLRYALEPLDFLTRAITHTSSQPHDTQPPQINDPRHEHTGLKYMVQTVYDHQAVSADGEPAATTPGTLSQQVLDQFPCGIVGLDASGAVVYANTKAPVVTDSNGVRSVELLFKSDDTLASWLAASTANKVADDRFWPRVQNRLPDAPGRQVFDVAAHYQKNGADGIDTILVCVNRTGHYQGDEEEMDFIALAAHELRGPITVIRGYLDVMLSELGPEMQPDQRELLDRLIVSANRLSGYVSNVLNVSRYDRRHLRLHLHEYRLIDIYAGIADDLQLRAQTQRRLLAINIPETLPTVAADRDSISEVLANLVDNALKYSNEGGQVIVSATADSDYVNCSVQDFGMGIPNSVANNLFGKFYRSHRSRQAVAGTGLGLYISKGIIESHGGRIGFSSKEGAGTTFTFSLPIYATVADKLLASDNKNEGIIESSSGWIKNHSTYRG